MEDEILTPEELPSEDSPDATENDTAAAELARTARQLGKRLAQHSEVVFSQSSFSDSNFHDDVFEDDEAALRWRHALLRLSETFLDAAEERRDLSPILLGALHNALEQLLIHGEEADLMALEEWLSHEAPLSDDTRSTPGEERDERRTADFLMAGENGVYNGENRRNQSDRRSQSERRQTERRT